MWPCCVHSCLPSVHYAPNKEAIESLWSQILALDDLVQYTPVSHWLWLQPELSLTPGGLLFTPCSSRVVGVLCLLSESSPSIPGLAHSRYTAKWYSRVNDGKTEDPDSGQHLAQPWSLRGDRQTLRTQGETQNPLSTHWCLCQEHGEDRSS